jgi:hypothetical protein
MVKIVFPFQLCRLAAGWRDFIFFRVSLLQRPHMALVAAFICNYAGKIWRLCAGIEMSFRPYWGENETKAANFRAGVR